MKKIFLYIYTFIHHLFEGLHNADNIAFSQSSNNENDNNGTIEVKDEQDSVYNDLLKGEITQEVKELRHEMYESDRLSHKYSYGGAGLSEEKTFVEKPKFSPHENYTIAIVQENKEDTGGIYDNLSEEDLGRKNYKQYTLNIERDFISRFRIEEYTENLVVENGEYDCILNFYIPKFEEQFNRIHKPFLNEIKSVLNGNVRSDILSFDTVSFITSKAWGCDDLYMFTYKGCNFFEIKENDSHYILSFKCVSLDDGVDLQKQYFDETADYKSKNHIKRNEEATISFDTVANQIVNS